MISLGCSYYLVPVDFGANLSLKRFLELLTPIPLCDKSEIADEVSLSESETQLLSLTDSITELEIEILQINSDYESVFGISSESSQTDLNVTEHGKCGSSDYSLYNL